MRTDAFDFALRPAKLLRTAHESRILQLGTTRRQRIWHKNQAALFATRVLGVPIVKSLIHLRY